MVGVSLLALCPPKGTQTEVAEERDQDAIDEEMLVIWALGVALSSLPHVYRKPQREQAEEHSSDLKEEYAADPAEGAEKTANAAARGARGFANHGLSLLAHIVLRAADLGRNFRARLPRG